MRATAVVNLPLDIHRTYLFIVATSDIVVTISGGEPFTIPAGGHWSPLPAPVNAITLTGTGTVVQS